MKKRILPVLTVLILLTMTACSVNVGGDRIDFTGSKDDFAGDTAGFAGKVSLQKGTTLTEEKNIARSADGIEWLEIANNAGNITVKGTSSKEINIKAVKKVKGTDEEAKKEVIEKIDITVEDDGNRMTIYPSKDGGKMDDLWKWAEQMYKGLQISVDFEVEVPEGIKAYEISNNAGNLSLESVTGEMNIRQNAGNITMKTVALKGANSIVLNAGTADIAADIDKADKLSIKNTAGNVKLVLPKKAAFNLEAKLTAGNISGDFLSGTKLNSGTLKQQINGGGIKVSVTIVAGNATINYR